MNKNFILLTLGLFLFSFATAEINNYVPITKGECITIIQSCSSCSYVNISISYPDSTLAITNQPLANQGSGTWSYEFCNTSQQGRYDVRGSGDLSGTPTSFDVLYFEVNEYGIDANLFMLYAGFYLVLIFLSFLFVYKLATSDGKGVKDYNFFFWAGFLDLIVFVLIEVNGFAGTNTLIVQVIKMIAFGSGAYFLSQGIYYAVSWKKSNY